MKKQNVMWIIAGALALATTAAVASERRTQDDHAVGHDPKLRDKWRQAALWEQCNAAKVGRND